MSSRFKMKIDAVSLHSTAGQDSYQVFANIMRQQSNGAQQSIRQLGDLPLYARIAELCITGLTNIIKNKVINVKTHFLILLPRGLPIDWLTALISEMFPALKPAQIKIQTMTTCATDALDCALEKLEQQNGDTLIFGGVDSLTHLGKSEASAFVRMTNQDPFEQSVIIQSLGTSPEIRHNLAENNTLDGLLSAVDICLRKADISLHNVDAIVAPIPAELPYEFEWHQTKTALWPYQVSREQQRAIESSQTSETLVLSEVHQPEEINPSLALGSVGAAQLPLALVIAYHRLLYPHPKIQRLLICETPDFAWRGAVYVSSNLLDTNMA